MSGGIGTCKNPTCGQAGTLLEDRHRWNDCYNARQPAASTGARP
jgi:hypothetical protein